MTNEKAYAPVSYGCNGATVKFSFPWKILTQNDLTVYLKEQGGSTKVLKLGTEYSVKFEAMGGEITTTEVYSTGATISIYRNMSNLQKKSYSTSPGFQASEIEKSFDSVSCNLQEMDWNIENFKDTFTLQIEGEIDNLEGVIQDNKQEVLTIQERFEDEVNTKIETVSEAAGKIAEFEESIEVAVNAAEMATIQAQSAQASVVEIENKIAANDTKMANSLAQSVAAANNAINTLSATLKNNQITNCLTEIPNRINLDLTDGVLTLKKGSVVTVPNGVNVFDEIKLSKDLSLSQNANNICTLFYYPSGARLVAYSGTITSGEGDPSYIGYNATTNKVLRIPSSGDRAQLSFPIAIIRMEGASVTEILEVFDGFGYIGSTIWAERGVKGLIADGRNADGTCKNIAFETTKVVVRTLGSSIQGIYRPCVRGSNATFYMAREPKLNYDNYLYASGERVLGVPFCKVNFVDGVVTSFEPYTAFRAIDFNEFSEMENVIETLKTEKLSATAKKSASGYVKLSNGIIIQWGQDTGHTTSTGTITLPTAFSSLHYVPIVTDVGTAKLVNSAVAESTTTFTWWQSGSGTRYFNWIAIGY